MSVDIKQSDVVRLILQYLKENKLNQAFQALQSETRVGLNIVESKDQLYLDIKAGKWDLVLQQTLNVALPPEVLIELYEQIIFEMKEIGE